METNIKTFAHDIAEDLCLYGIQVLKQELAPVPVRQKVNHIIIFDRSGSMTWHLPKLCDDLIKLTEVIPSGDTLTLGWFSSEGQYNWIFKGLDVYIHRTAIIDTINKHRHSVALTCFSDILTDTAEHVIDDLSALGGSFSLTFLTDGYPVVSNYQKEVTRVMGALKKISATISTVLFIGYGDYYNKELMAKMAEQCGGALVHANDIEEFTDSATHIVTGNVSAKRFPVVLPVRPYEPEVKIYSVFSVGASGITMIPTDGGGVALVPEGVDWIWVLTNVHYPEFRNDYYGEFKDEYVPLLSAAYIEVASTRTDQAMTILNHVGDVRLMKLVTNAWTNAEYGKAQGEILQAVLSPSTRFTGGFSHSFVPDPGAFCLVDALNLLIDDDRAFFYPHRKEFNYKRTGRKTVTKEGYPEFESESSVSCSFSKLVWNSKRLNLGVLTTIPGTVDLGMEAMDHGLPPVFKSLVWRNYTIVKDGILNTTSIPTSMSKETFDTLRANGMIDTKYIWNTLGIFPVKLDAVPIVNKNLAEPVTAQTYCGWLANELSLEYHMKYLKWWLNEVDPTGETKETPYTADQIEFLKTKGINAKGEYAPPVDKEEATDYYYAKEFEVKIDGFSNAPKVQDVNDKLKSGKSLTPSQDLMANIIHKYDALANRAAVSKDNGSLAEWIADQINIAKNDLNAYRRMIQTTRFAVLLCKKWFPDLAERDGAVVNASGYSFLFSIRDVKVEY